MDLEMDPLEIRRDAWTQIRKQSLVGKVKWQAKTGTIAIESAVQLLHPLIDNPFTEVIAISAKERFNPGDLLMFTLKEMTSLRWRESGELPPIVDSRSVRATNSDEFERLRSECQLIVQPYISSLPTIFEIGNLVDQLSELEKNVSTRRSELDSLNIKIAGADDYKLELEIEARSIAEEQRQSILRSTYEEVAAIVQVAQEESERKRQAIELEVRKASLVSEELEEKKEIFKNAGGDRFVVALGYDYRKLERQMKNVEKPENLLSALDGELTKLGVEIEISTLRRMVVAHALAALTGQIVLYVGPPGSGKSTSGVLLPSLLGMKASVIPVRPGWLDATDLLGYFDPRNERFVSSPFIDMVVEAIADRDIGRFHTVVLDEMNLARIENYGADILSQLEKSYEGGKAGLIRLYSAAVQREIDSRKIANESQINRFTEIPAEIDIPNNLIISGTINNDDSTESISQKVIDRCVVVRVPRVLPKPRFERNVKPEEVYTLTRFAVTEASVFTESDESQIALYWDKVMSLISVHKVPGLENALSQRFARAIVCAPAVARLTGLDMQEVIDDILSLKILAWVRYFRGQEPGAEDELRKLIAASNELGFSGFVGEIESILGHNDEFVHYLR